MTDDRALQEIPAFLMLGTLIAIVGAMYFRFDPYSAVGIAWILGAMVGPWLLFMAVLQLDWYRKHGEWI